MPTGLWLIGARGSVAVTSTLGLLALRSGLAPSTGSVTALPPFASAGLPDWGELVVGGHDIASVPLLKKAQCLADTGVLPALLPGALTDEIESVEREMRPAPHGRTTQAEAAEAIRADLDDFTRRHRLDRTVVVNVSNTEPVPEPHPAHQSLDALRSALTTTETVLPPSSLYAYAAFTAGCPYVDFTPSIGARIPALAELARERGLPYAGHDGKTGETLLKSVIAPMFAMRHLQVRSWSGVNLLGGGDGANLTNPDANAAKTASKQRVLGEILGHDPQGNCRIDFVEDLGDFKTAWDLVTFSGFLGTRMRMEFTWHGCDSALAAPLILDLARLTAAAHRAGVSGPLRELAFFFKDPLDPPSSDGPVPHALAAQWDTLLAFAQRLGTDTAPGRSAARAATPETDAVPPRAETGPRGTGAGR